MAARWVRTCAVVHSEHGLEADAIAQEPWRRSKFRRLAFELADRVLSVSFQLRDLLARRTGFPADRITVVHNGVDGLRFSPDPRVRTGMRQELGLAEGEFCIGCVGNLLPVKDHMTLLRAMAGFAEIVPRWRLLIAGEGPEMAGLHSFVAADPALKTQVSFLGSYGRVPELLNALDVYVLPSMSEGISNSLLEAMATGLPVVASAVGGNCEVVVDGQSGLLFPAGDVCQLTERLVRLWENGGLRWEIGQQALRRARENFSIQAMMQRYEEIYTSLRTPEVVPQALAGVR
jgi:glycosyltransferase involved in cell wall biosynthesis